jgi:hypothetical protein
MIVIPIGRKTPSVTALARSSVSLPTWARSKTRTVIGGLLGSLSAAVADSVDTKVIKRLLAT